MPTSIIVTDDATSSQAKDFFDLLIAEKNPVVEDLSHPSAVVESHKHFAHVIRMVVPPSSDPDDDEEPDDEGNEENDDDEEKTNNNKKRKLASSKTTKTTKTTSATSTTAAPKKDGPKTEAFVLGDDAYATGTTKPRRCFKVTPEQLAALRDPSDMENKEKEKTNLSMKTDLLKMVENPDFFKTTAFLTTENSKALYIRACVEVMVDSDDLAKARKENLPAYNDSLYLIPVFPSMLEHAKKVFENDKIFEHLDECSQLSSAEVKNMASREGMNMVLRKAAEAQKKKADPNYKSTAHVFDPAGKSFVTAGGRFAGGGSSRTTLAVKALTGSKAKEFDSKRRDTLIYDKFNEMQLEIESLKKKAKVVDSIHPINGSDVCMITLNGEITTHVDCGIAEKSMIFFKPNEELDGMVIG
jgi:hypothetical protein